MTSSTQATAPDVRRPDSAAVFVTTSHVPDPDAGSDRVRELVEQWASPRPPEILSCGVYLNTDRDTVLTYVQCTDAEVYRPFTRSLRGAARAEPVEYRLRRSVVLYGGVPGCVVVATFDVDGPDRQQEIINGIADSLESVSPDRHPGMLSANFHTSVDGSRVLNYAEWTSDRAHVAFLDGATRVTTLRISNGIPGVRPIGFKRYHVQWATEGAGGSASVPENP